MHLFMSKILGLLYSLSDSMSSSSCVYVCVCVCDKGKVEDGEKNRGEEE